MHAGALGMQAGGVQAGRRGARLFLHLAIQVMGNSVRTWNTHHYRPAVRRQGAQAAVDGHDDFRARMLAAAPGHVEDQEE